MQTFQVNTIILRDISACEQKRNIPSDICIGPGWKLTFFSGVTESVFLCIFLIIL